MGGNIRGIEKSRGMVSAEAQAMEFELDWEPACLRRPENRVSRVKKNSIIPLTTTAAMLTSSIIDNRSNVATRHMD